ncbi:hypothetical protein F5882DRAFT_377049 [Hyaloscypha sp. PMI_1271]|nr:hypothetical protein F5882DRAFT_377049 [Hyaloscypha sp. PMI_1271]
MRFVPAQSSTSLLFLYLYFYICLLLLTFVFSSISIFNFSSRIQSPEVPLALISTFALRERATSINRDSQQCRQLPQLPSDNEIIDACDRNPPCHENGNAIRGLMYPAQAPIFWIKYGLRSEGRDAEARTHDFAFRALERIPQSEREGIRTLRFTAFLQMIILLENPWCISSWIPHDATPGPYGGGLIRHPLFKDYQANIEYSSVAQLQHHINKVNASLPGDVPTVDLSKEKLYFCFSDLYEGNFILSHNGSLYVLDFEHASFLPISLMTYALIKARPVCTAIRDKLSLPQENLPGMRLACSYFVMSTRRIVLDTGLPL